MSQVLSPELPTLQSCSLEEGTAELSQREESHPANEVHLMCKVSSFLWHPAGGKQSVWCTSSFVPLIELFEGCRLSSLGEELHFCLEEQRGRWFRVQVSFGQLPRVPITPEASHPTGRLYSNSASPSGCVQVDGHLSLESAAATVAE